MLLAVSGIVHATASFETVAAEIEVCCVTRVFSRSPFGSVHGTANAAVDAAAVAVVTLGAAGFVERAMA